MIYYKVHLLRLPYYEMIDVISELKKEKNPALFTIWKYSLSILSMVLLYSLRFKQKWNIYKFKKKKK